MSLHDRLKSKLINLTQLSKVLWPEIDEKSASSKMKNKVNGKQRQRLTENDIEQIEKILLEQVAGLDLPNLLIKIGFKKIGGIYEFKHGSTHLALELADDRYFLFDGRPDVQSNYQEGNESDLDIGTIAKMLANYGRNLLRSY